MQGSGERKAQQRAAALRARAVLEAQRATVVFGDLAAEREADSRSLCGSRPSLRVRDFADRSRLNPDGRGGADRGVRVRRVAACRSRGNDRSLQAVKAS
jgi:hypothetical protein